MDQDAVEKPVEPRSESDERATRQDAALQRLVQRAVVDRFKRISGLDTVAATCTRDSSYSAVNWLDGDHPLCRECQRQETCRLGCARLLKRSEAYRAAAIRCPRGNWRMVMPLIVQGVDLIACKLVCPPAAGKQAFESAVELLLVLRENLAIKARASTIRRSGAQGVESSLLQPPRDCGSVKSVNPLVQCARNLIERRWRDPSLSVAGVARALGVNPSYLAHVFSREVGEHMKSYITALRIERAKELLVGTRWQIKRISFECGFARPNWFSEAFRKQTGLTPGKYRRRQR